MYFPLYVVNNTIVGSSGVEKDKPTTPDPVTTEALLWAERVSNKAVVTSPVDCLWRSVLAGGDDAPSLAGPIFGKAFGCQIWILQTPFSVPALESKDGLV